MNFVEFREWLNGKIETYLDDRMAGYEGISGNQEIVSPILHVKKLAASGKRIRAYMAFLGMRSGGIEDTASYEKLFIGLELFHLFCLVHDDVIDKGALRRGVPTVHEVVKDSLTSKERIGDLSHLANGQAILVGDLLFQWSQECFADAIREKFAAQAEIRRMVDEVVIGQMIDVDLMSMNHADNELIERKMLLKTAGYTFIRPLRIGLLCADVEEEQLLFADTFGKAIGLAFQIQDDMLDIVGGDAVGKTVLSDVQDGQHTYFTNAVFEQGSPQQKERLQSVFGKTIPSEESAEIIALFEDSGAIAQGRESISLQIEKAKASVNDSQMNEVNKHAFLELVALMEKRNA